MESLHDRQTVISAIGRTVSPYVGDSVGHSAGTYCCKKLGLNGSNLSGSDIELIMKELTKSLKVFLGATKAEAVVDEVRRSVRAGGVR